ncbi:HepT-like ribonuclease domain-containing protein [Coleofasciculus sp. F4-SAH-05]|uniref:HepT-like ribonuclease domain-containing protein n=1 Tax=Coleofasciculus sp. F4-SAH-05 TaxID=3069525 RepID=UPI0033037717
MSFPQSPWVHPEIPINAIRGMRNRVVHEYKEVDIKILWEVIQINIPQLLQQMQTSLAEMKE